MTKVTSEKESPLKPIIWSKGDRRPDSEGVYLRHFPKDGGFKELYSYWNGEEWSVGYSKKEIVKNSSKASKKQNLRWRDLTCTSKKKVPKKEGLGELKREKEQFKKEIENLQSKLDLSYEENEKKNQVIQKLNDELKEIRDENKICKDMLLKLGEYKVRKGTNLEENTDNNPDRGPYFDPRMLPGRTPLNKPIRRKSK